MIQDDSRSSSPSPTMNFDYLYEFSETRKVLEEFFKSGTENQDTQQLQFQVDTIIFVFKICIKYFILLKTKNCYYISKLLN